MGSCGIPYRGTPASGRAQTATHAGARPLRRRPTGRSAPRSPPRAVQQLGDASDVERRLRYRLQGAVPVAPGRFALGVAPGVAPIRTAPALGRVAEPNYLPSARHTSPSLAGCGGTASRRAAHVPTRSQLPLARCARRMAGRRGVGRDRGRRGGLPPRYESTSDVGGRWRSPYAWSSSMGAASRGSLRAPETAGFGREEQSGPALLLVVRSDRLRLNHEDGRNGAGAGARSRCCPGVADAPAGYGGCSRRASSAERKLEIAVRAFESVLDQLLGSLRCRDASVELRDLALGQPIPGSRSRLVAGTRRASARSPQGRLAWAPIASPGGPSWPAELMRPALS
jgi:hypothetical protein